MKKSSLIIAFSIILLGAGCPSHAPSSTNSSTPAQSVPQAHLDWTLVATLEGNFDGKGQRESAHLYKSTAPAGTDGFDNPEYGVKLIVTDASGAQLFSDEPSIRRQDSEDYWPRGYFRGGNSESKNFFKEDITGDGMPEIIFKTGIAGVSDDSNCYNIVTYQRAKKEFVLINDGDFCASYNTGIRITKLASSINGSQIIKSIPSDGIIGGHKWAQPFDTTVYTWNGSSFGPYKTYRSSRSYEGGKDVFEGEIYKITESWVSN